MRKVCYLLLAAPLLFVSCKHGPLSPATPFAEMETPAAPDYSKPESWAAHPDRKDSADAIVPGSGFTDVQATSPVDVFFIHPTIYNSDKGWNASLQDASLMAQIQKSTLRYQASIFNGVGRVYAPHYREATLGTFYQKDKRNLASALGVAYSDVRNSFEYYLAHENEGRPIIIATHSQGTVHGIRLMREFFDGKDLGRQLVAAYLPGWMVPVDTFKVLRPCASPAETGCVCSWLTFQEGFLPEWFDTTHALVTVNPVTWQNDHVRAQQSAAKGAVLWKFDLHPGIVDPVALNGAVWIHKPDIPGKWLYTSKNYHTGDYNLFYQDVRENAVLRRDAFLQKH